jgi:hypothetical protein
MGLYEPPQEFSEDGWIMESGSIIVDPSLNERDSIIMPVHELPAIRKPETRKPKEVLVEVCKLTGLNLKEILTSRRGKGANPARRFAVWALHQSTTCTQKEIAGTLEMPFSQVTSLLSRFRHREQSVTIRKWMETWHDSE